MGEVCVGEVCGRSVCNGCIVYDCSMTTVLSLRPL